MKLYFSGTTNHTKGDYTMFDINRVGQRISKLRKQCDMTQMELADRMGISFQAVSNWERGQTMPDIAKLYELSEIFGVPIDDILENERSARIIDSMEKGTEIEEPVTPAELADVAPILRPSQVESTAEDFEPESLPLSELVMLAPFVSTELLDSMALRASDALDTHILQALMPFVSQSAADALFERGAAQWNDFSSLIPLAPFVSDGTLDAVAARLCEQSGNAQSLVALAPFLSTGAVDRCAQIVLARDGAAQLAPLAPFLSKETLSAIAREKIQKEGIASIMALLPFLDEDALELPFKK